MGLPVGSGLSSALVPSESEEELSSTWTLPGRYRGALTGFAVMRLGGILIAVMGIIDLVEEMLNVNDSWRKAEMIGALISVLLDTLDKRRLQICEENLGKADNAGQVEEVCGGNM